MANFVDFEKIELHNFGSYGHAELELKNKGFCLVSGQNNFKKDNALSNGSGKSLIWNAICFALTGETLNGLQKNLKNVNVEDDDKCYVRLLLKVNADEYDIMRAVSPKSDVQITKNGVDVSGKTYRESEKKLGELLPDLTKDLIASTTIIGQGMPNKFSSFSPSGRKELLEKLTKSDFMIEDIKNRVSARQDELNRKVRECEDSLLLNDAKLKAAERDLDRVQRELDSAEKPDFDKSIAESDRVIEAIEAQIAAAAAVKKAKDDDMAKAKEALLTISSEKSKLAADELLKYHEAVDPIKSEKLTNETTISNLSAEVRRLKAVKDVCPTCGQKLPGAVKPDTSRQEAEIKRLTESLMPLNGKLAEIEAKHIGFTKEIDDEFAEQERVTRDALARLKTELVEASNDVEARTNDLAVERDKRNRLTYDKANWDAKRKALTKTATDLDTSITGLKNAMALTDGARNDLLAHLAIVKKMDSLAKRDFRGYLLTNIIGYIDKKAKDYSEIVFGTRDLSVYIDGNALDISYCGKMFDNLSGGEKQRVDLILQFAIRDMLNVYLNSSANILVLDEITDFLDKKSCSAIMKLIEKELTSVESVFIVSHHASELDIPVDSEIRVVKDADGISAIL